MEKIEGGAIIIARKIIENEIFSSKPAIWFKIFFYILFKTTFKDRELFKRGECFLKYQWIIEATGATKDQIYPCIKWLRQKAILTTRKTTRGIQIKVLNYDKYQTLSNYKNDTKNDIITTRKLQASDTILKKDNNIKEKKNDNLQAEPADTKISPDINISENKTTAELEKLPIIIQKTNQAVPTEQIQEIITLFRNTNPVLKYNNLTERKAVIQLINNYNFEGAKRLSEYAISIQNNPYAPLITTPYELTTKMTKLKAYEERGKSINKNNINTYGNTKQKSKTNKYSGVSKQTSC